MAEPEGNPPPHPTPPAEPPALQAAPAARPVAVVTAPRANPPSVFNPKDGPAAPSALANINELLAWLQAFGDEPDRRHPAAGAAGENGEKISPVRP